MLKLIFDLYMYIVGLNGLFVYLLYLYYLENNFEKYVYYFLVFWWLNFLVFDDYFDDYIGINLLSGIDNYYYLWLDFFVG